MTEPSPASQYRTFAPPLELEDVMTPEQAMQLKEQLYTALHSSEGCWVVNIVIKNHHVRWIQGGALEDFVKP